MGDSCTLTPTISLITILFPINPEKYIGYTEMAIGFGMMIGPIIGSLIHFYLEYANTFFVFGCIYSLSAVNVFFNLPKDINTLDNKLDESEITRNTMMKD